MSISSVFHFALIFIIVINRCYSQDYVNDYNEPAISANSGTNEIDIEEKYAPKISGSYIEVKILKEDEDNIDNSTASIEVQSVANGTERNVENYTEDAANFTTSYSEQSRHKLYRTADGSEEERDTTTLVNYPFVVSIQRKGSHYATGALLDKRWILTIAGEFYNVRESIKLYRARLGSVDNKKGGALVPIKHVVVHPAYVYRKPDFDVAMMMMGQPVDYNDFIRPISLSRLTTKVIGAKFMTTYWPRLIVKGHVLPLSAKERIQPTSLRVSTQRLIPPTKCNSMMQLYNTTLDESTLCLKPFVSHHSVCIPDAGAPVVGDDGLWGITSGWTPEGCKANPSPTVFTRISTLAVRSWLDSQRLDIIL